MTQTFRIFSSGLSVALSLSLVPTFAQTPTAAVNAAAQPAVSPGAPGGMVSAAVTSILVYDHSTQHNLAQTAAFALSPGGTVVANSATFDGLLAGGPWDVVAVDCPSTIPAAGWGALITYVQNGGQVVVGFWDWDINPALMTAFECSLSSSIGWTGQTLQDSGTSTIFSGVTMPNSDWHNHWGDDGDQFNPLGTAVGLAHIGNPATPVMVLGNSGKTIASSVLDEAGDTWLNDGSGVMLWRNMMEAVAGGCDPTVLTDCYIPNGTPGCNEPCIEATVCAVDPFCCSVSWDSICAGEATSTGALPCDTDGDGTPDICEPPPACDPTVLTDCYIPNGTPGCTEPCIEATVCAVDPFCCSVSWDSICAGEATSTGALPCDTDGDGTPDICEPPPAGPLYGAMGNGSAVNPGTVASLDQTSYAGKYLASVAGGLTGITSTPDGKLWACSGGFVLSTLYELDPDTGATLGSVAVSPAIQLGDLAVQPGTGKIFGWERGKGRLHSITTGGVATLIGTPGDSKWGGLAFAQNGTLYHISSQVATSQLRTISPTTGALLTTLTYGPDSGCDGGVVLDDGTLLGTRGSFAGGDRIIKIDPVTGATTQLGSTGVGTCSDLALRCPPVTATTTVRLGTIPNPNAFLPGTQQPIIGTTWDPRVDHTTFLPSAILDFAGIAINPSDIFFGPPFGTLLCDPIILGTVQTTGPGVPFAYPIPFVCAFTGKTLCVAAGSVTGSLVISFTNALDIVVGTN